MKKGRRRSPKTPAAGVDRCQHRFRARRKGKREVACCGLLRAITGIEDERYSTVGRDACEVCVKLPAPTTARINQVLASFLYQTARRVIEEGGVAGCDPGKAVGIRAWAERNLAEGGEKGIDLAGLARVGVGRHCCYFGRRVGVREIGKVPGTSGRAREVVVHECRHPDRQETTPEECFRCREWSEEPGRRAEFLRTGFSRPPRRGAEVRRWAVGVTTAPRLQTTLPYCLDSLIRAGWEAPRLFADSTAEVEERHEALPLSVREPRLGAWPSYYLALVELLLREPEADAYLIAQDDALFYDQEDLRAYLEETLWPGDDVGAVSLYCSRAYARKEPGWHVHDGAWVWGAVAFIFPRESATRFVADPEVLEHRWSPRNGGRANIDVVIGRWAKRQGLRIYYPSPSLVEHIGETSTLWPSTRARGHRRAHDFRRRSPSRSD